MSVQISVADFLGSHLVICDPPQLNWTNSPFFRLIRLTTTGKQMNQLIKMFLMIMAATFAPIWIPFAVITVAPTSLFLAGLLSTVAVVITGILTIISSLLGIPLLLIIVAMMLAYLSYKATEELGAKAQRLTKRFLRELNISGRNWSLMNIDVNI